MQCFCMNYIDHACRLQFLQISVRPNMCWFFLMQGFKDIKYDITMCHEGHEDQALAGSRISIPEFFKTGFPNIFDPEILLKSFVIFRNFCFCFICLLNRIIFINLYHHHRHNHNHHHYHSSQSMRSSFAALLSHYPQIDVRNHIVTMPITVLMCWKGFSPECGVLCALSKCCQKTCIYHANHN